jgi:hypothetical protein
MKIEEREVSGGDTNTLTTSKHKAPFGGVIVVRCFHEGSGPRLAPSGSETLTRRMPGILLFLPLGSHGTFSTEGTTKHTSPTVRTMPKRKREAAEEPDEAGGPGGESLPGLQYARIERLIEIGQKALHEALKLARGFERQKLGRRQKTADAKDDKASSTRVKAEVQALKVRRVFSH